MSFPGRPAHITWNRTSTMKAKLCARVKRIGTTPGEYPLHANMLKTSYCEALATAARSWPSVFIYALNQGADLMEHRPYPPDATNPPQSKFPWPLIAVIVAAVLLGVIVAV